MALINCPECQREISDTAETCPNCGYPLAKKESSKIKSTPLGEKRTYPALGIPLIFFSIVLLLFGLVMLPTLFGFGGLIGFGLLFSGGHGLIVGSQKGTCPYCGQELSILSNAQAFKCPRCHKRSIRKDNNLETVD